jgi:hypothetical protein
MIVTVVAPPGDFPQYAGGACVAGRYWAWAPASTVVSVSTHDLTALEASVLWANAMPLADHTRQRAMLDAAILVENAERLPLWPFGHVQDAGVVVAAPSDNWNPRQIVALADDVCLAHAAFGPGAVGYVDIELSSAGGAIEDSSIRTRIGQRALLLLQADARFVLT